MLPAEIVLSARKMTLFRQLSDEQLDRLAHEALVQNIPKGALFFTEAELANGLHVLLSGHVKLYKTSESGREQTIFLFQAGEPFCLCSLFSDGQQPANLAALEDSQVLVLPPDRFERLSREDPSLLMNLLRVVSFRLKKAMELIDTLSLKQAPARIAAYLLDRTEIQHADASQPTLSANLDLGITHRELAKILGLSPEALSRSLRRMANDDILRVTGEHIELLDRKSLEAIRSGQ